MTTEKWRKHDRSFPTRKHNRNACRPWKTRSPCFRSHVTDLSNLTFPSSLQNTETRYFVLYDEYYYSTDEMSWEIIERGSRDPHPRRPRGSQSGRENWGGTKLSSTSERALGYRLPPNYFQKFKEMPVPDWAQKMLCIIVLNRRTVSLFKSRFSVKKKSVCGDNTL